MSRQRAEELFTLCESFIREQRIDAPENIYQCDWVIENAYEFIEQVCEIVGYHEPDEPEEDG